MNINLDFNTNFEHLQSLVYQLGRVENDAEKKGVKEKIHTQIELLGTFAILNSKFRNVLKTFNGVAASALSQAEIDQLPRALELVRKKIFKALPRKLRISLPKTTPKKSEVTASASIAIRLPSAMYRLICEYLSTTDRYGGAFRATDTIKILNRQGVVRVSKEFRAVVDTPYFWLRSVQELGIFGIDKKNPREALIERIREDVLVYQEMFPQFKLRASIFIKFKFYREFAAKNPALVYEDKALKDIFSDREWPEMQHMRAVKDAYMRAILDLNIPLNLSHYGALSLYSPEIQQEMLNRLDLSAFAMPPFQALLIILNIARDEALIKRKIEKYIEASGKGVDMDYGKLVRGPFGEEKGKELAASLKLIHSRFEELAQSKGLPSPSLEAHRSAIGSEMLSTIIYRSACGCGFSPVWTPVLVMLLNLFPNDPVDPLSLEKVRTVHFGLAEVTEALGARQK